ncbi:DUF4829 domain-containing protein [Candidatus Galacturonibacter soehngenii]|uniref:DUF4829 domain-containing protein n=1 Tax=Candidatus Galacturonatibacter soehngenii TaxID=2307010 RepID=A0A7V7UG07_9FIRM|nr:DUF4829 domain-containing protein [Candidatus Galacturonibacter soehngenii]KAB1438026.1 DUF4829 domain-containing protein [Candidatus Galacturonibacter soehngenii]
MKKRTLLKFIITILIFVIILFFVIFIYKSSKYNRYYTYYDLLSSKQTVENSFKYKNSKEEKKLYSLYSDDLANAIKNGLDNIKKININDVSFIQDDHLYSGYLGSGLGSINNTQRKDLIIYEVSYEVEYYDDSTEPLENGNQISTYFLVKNNGKWIITDIGYY